MYQCSSHRLSPVSEPAIHGSFLLTADSSWLSASTRQRRTSSTRVRGSSAGWRVHHDGRL